MTSDQRGFTLLELLVALVVNGLLIGGLVQGTRFGLAATERVARRGDAHGELESTDRLLRRLVAAMDPSGPALPLTGTALVGTPGTIAFRSPHPIAIGLDAQRRLVLRESSATTPARETILIEGLDRIAFDYWQTNAWLPTWRADTLPTMIRLRLTFPPGDPRHWPDIVIAIRRDAPTR